jgi:hypothetical protein
VDAEISAGNKRKIQKKARAKRKKFGVQAREKFLSHFASSCNATAAARAAGVGISTVYMARMHDPEFRAHYAAALEQGYATLEAEMVRRATAAAKRGFEPSAEGEATLANMDPKVALSLLQLHRKGIECGLGNTRPRRSDVEEARARLEKRMRALGLIGAKRRRSSAPAEAGAPFPRERPCEGRGPDARSASTASPD